MKVLVIGAGIAGSAVALGLKRAGHDVEIFDRVEPPSQSSAAAGADWVPADVGGAVLASENVLRCLHRLGVLDDITAAGSQFDGYNVAGLDGTVFASFLAFDGPNFRTTGVLRSAIVRAFHTALNALGVRMKAGKKLIAIDQSQPDGSLGVVARFEDGSVAHGDILVAADGIHSAARSLLFPDVHAERTRFSGYFAVSSLDGLPPPPVRPSFMMDVKSGNQAFVLPCGNTVIHWAMYESRPEANDNTSWDLGGSNDPSLEIGRIMALADKWGLPDSFKAYVRDSTRVVRVNFTSLAPMPQWHKQNCVLIGDAAHPVLPSSGQGAGMALETAVALPLMLERFPRDPARAFQLLHEFRAARTRKVAAFGERAAQITVGSSAATAAVGHFFMKLMAHVNRLLRVNSYGEDIVRYDCHDAAVKFLASKT
ncbi:hypothetical protein HK405_008303 [Cladochytrium tenue]|nr:hypothetical protein HK405_008303 [Cladochytrium tenue]